MAAARRYLNVRSTRDGRVRESAVLVVMTLLAVASYDMADTARFNAPNATDPWIYTGAMWNFDFLYRFFDQTYYLSRLPWIIPGYALNRVLSPQESFYVLHFVFALTAAGSGFLIARRVYGRTAAFAAFGALITSVLFYDSYSTDYPDGAQITFLLVALAFAVFSYGGARSRAKLGAAGFFTAAAVCTNLFAGLLVGGLLLLYLLFVVTGFGLVVRPRLVDAVCFVFGAALLVLACGSFAHAHGGPFLFFRPSLDAISSISTASSKPADNAWVGVEPRLLVPPFLLAFVAVSWRRGGWRRDAGVRLAAGSFVFLGVVSLVLAVWEFAGAGDFLFLTPYFRLLTVGFVLCTAAGVALLAKRAGLDRDNGWVVAAALALVAGGAPTLVIYGDARVGYTGRPAMLIVALLMGLTLAAAALLRVAPARRRRIAVVLVSALAIFSSNLAVAASSSTVGSTAATVSTAAGSVVNYQAEGPAAMDVASGFIRFMKVNGLEERRPAFWFAGRDGASVANGLTSLYLYGYWTVAKTLPAINTAFRQRLRQLAPRTLILLCERRDCAGAQHMLREGGYRVRLLAADELSAPPLEVHVRAYDLPDRGVQR